MARSARPSLLNPTRPPPPIPKAGPNPSTPEAKRPRGSVPSPDRGRGAIRAEEDWNEDDPPFLTRVNPWGPEDAIAAVTGGGVRRIPISSGRGLGRGGRDIGASRFSVQDINGAVTQNPYQRQPHVRNSALGLTTAMTPTFLQPHVVPEYHGGLVRLAR